MRPKLISCGMRHDPTQGSAWLARIDLVLSVRTDRLDWRHDVRLESFLPEVAAVETFDAMGNVFAAPGLVAGRDGPSVRSAPPRS